MLCVSGPPLSLSVVSPGTDLDEAAREDSRPAARKLPVS